MPSSLASLRQKANKKETDTRRGYLSPILSIRLARGWRVSAISCREQLGSHRT